MTTGEKIRKARQGEGLTQIQLAEMAQVHQMTLWNYEHDKLGITVCAMVRIAHALEVPPASLLPDEG